MLVSGSNMSGKSTLLRTVGTNAVLAFAGGTVRARRLAISEMSIGATIRVQDSLQAGASRFYAEITRLQIRDFNPKTGTLFIEETKSGKSRYVVLDDEGQRFFKAVCTGRKKGDTMFVKPSGSIWGKSHQSKEMQLANKKAKFSPPVTFHVFRHTYCSLLIENGAPLTIVARNLGHADTRMIEKHYGHLRKDYIAREIRAAAPKLGITGSR